MAVTQDLLSGMPLVLTKKYLIHLWSRILPELYYPTVRTQTPHCIHEDSEYNDSVVYESDILRLVQSLTARTTAKVCRFLILAKFTSTSTNSIIAYV